MPESNAGFGHQAAREVLTVSRRKSYGMLSSTCKSYRGTGDYYPHHPTGPLLAPHGIVQVTEYKRISITTRYGTDVDPRY
ncbi:MAG: hypothetical protein LC775_00225 [Acidobacteria bacterium]|nr:hypothetical protein [Acidobacteriota bacterium]